MSYPLRFSPIIQKLFWLARGQNLFSLQSNIEYKKCYFKMFSFLNIHYRRCFWRQGLLLNREGIVHRSGTHYQQSWVVDYYSWNHGLEEQKDCLGYRNSVRGRSYTFVRVTENKRISLVDENVNIVKFWYAKFR